jgi:hypothetical protein
MKLFGRSFGRSSADPEEDPGTVTRVTPSGSDPSWASEGAWTSSAVPAAVPPAPVAGAGETGTPVPSRLQRLAKLVEKARPGRAGRNVRKTMQTIGMAVIVLGFVFILLGWYGAAHSPYLYQEVPYLISGGLLGVAMVIGGGVLVRSAWTLRQIEEDRRNALAIVRSVDRLERILRSLDETRRTEQEEHSL